MRTRRRGSGVGSSGTVGLATDGEQREYEPITSKTQFVREYVKGTFGNRAPTWCTLGEYLASGYSGLIHVRNRVANADTWYNVRPKDVATTMRLALSKGYMPEQLYLSAMAPEDKKIFQGEVQQSTPVWKNNQGGLDLTYNTLPLPMREGMAKGIRTARGVTAALLLRFYLCPNSHEWMMELLRRYPGHIIEFSTYSCDWGTLPNFNTVVWEVRQY